MKEYFIQNIQFDLFSVELIIGETATLLMAENYVTIREVFVDGAKVEPNAEKQIFLTSGGDDLWELSDGDILQPKENKTFTIKKAHEVDVETGSADKYFNEKGYFTKPSNTHSGLTDKNAEPNFQHITQEEKQEISDNTIARHTHSNKSALDLVSGTNTGDQNISNLAVDAEVVHLAGDETITGGKAFAKGAIFYGQASPFPTGIGSYVAHYLSTAYNICRSLAYNGVAYVDYALGAFIAAKNKFSLVLKANGKAEFGSDVSIDGQLSTSTFVLNGITYDASSFKGRYDAETVSAPANAGILTLKNATETVVSTTLTNSNIFTIALPTAVAGKINESILIFKTGATLPTLTQPSGVVYRTEKPDIKINQTWTFCYERVSYDGGATFETYVSATKNV